MRKRIDGALTGVFAQPHELLHAVTALRAEGHELIEAWSPFPVHGLDDAIGLRPSRLPWACLAFALTGTVSAYLLQWWTSVVSYPVITGGKPLNSIPAFVPVIFELSVLLGALGVTFSLFVASRLRPRFSPPGLFDGVNDDRFVLALRPKHGYDREKLLTRLRELGAVEARAWGADHLEPAPDCGERKLGPVGLALIFTPAVLTLAAIPLLQRNGAVRNFDWDAGMLKGYPSTYDAPNALLPAGQTMQPPPAFTLARGAHQELFGATPAEADRAGLELTDPLPDTDASRARGKQLFNRICATCHGFEGRSDGPIIPKFPNPPSLQSTRAVAFPPGRIYHIITHGQGLMKGWGDVIAPDDRWHILHHLRALQRAGATPPAAAPAPAPASAPRSAP
jgi:mono/diheme cytochrome c family protein